MTPLKQQISLIPFSIEHTDIALTRRPLADKFLYGLPTTAYQCTKFQLPSSH